eukprot:12600017-Alexandrium_andersonii.AAC.1
MWNEAVDRLAKRGANGERCSIGRWAPGAQSAPPCIAGGPPTAAVAAPLITYAPRVGLAATGRNPGGPLGSSVAPSRQTLRRPAAASSGGTSARGADNASALSSSCAGWLA